MTGGGTSIVAENLSRVVRHIAGFVKEGKDVVLVTSGAIASGLSVLGFKKRPTELSELQAAAAVGQNILMHAYSIEFRKHDLRCAQILLTRDDFKDRKKYLRNTISTLLRHKIIPIINENDSVAVDEIKFGDNDTLSAYVAVVVGARGLLILTDIDCLYKNFESKTRHGAPLKEVVSIDRNVKNAACGTDNNASCIGGMSTKIIAARIAIDKGIAVIIANGLKDVLRIDFDAPSYDSYDGTRFARS